MNLEETIKVNRKIMSLIESKYPDKFPPSYPTPDSRYYAKLARDIAEADHSIIIFDKK